MDKNKFFDANTIPLKTRLRTLIEMDFINLIHHLGYREPKPWTDEDQHILDEICELAGSTADRCLHEFNQKKNP